MKRESYPASTSVRAEAETSRWAPLIKILEDSRRLPNLIVKLAIDHGRFANRLTITGWAFSGGSAAGDFPHLVCC